MNLDGFERIHLVGDEDCGVGLGCADCWDGGRPLAYYDRSSSSTAYTGVPTVGSVADLLAVGRAHLDERHGGG